MGGVGLDGCFVSGNPKQKLIEWQFKDGVETNFDPYGGGFGTIDRIYEIKLVRKDYNGKFELNYRLQNWMKEHPEYKKKDEILYNYMTYLSDEDEIDKWEVGYAVDYSSPCGYEVTTYGGRQELHIRNIRNIPESWIDSLTPKEKGYTVFEVGDHSAFRRGRNKFSTLQEIDDVVKKYVVLHQQTYFILKNDCSKMYVIKPNTKVVENTTKKTDYSNYSVCVNPRYPVYYSGTAGC